MVCHDSHLSETVSQEQSELAERQSLVRVQQVTNNPTAIPQESLRQLVLQSNRIVPQGHCESYAERCFSADGITQFVS